MDQCSILWLKNPVDSYSIDWVHQRFVFPVYPMNFYICHLWSHKNSASGMVSYEKNVNSEIETDKENGQDGFCFLLYGAIEAIVTISWYQGLSKELLLRRCSIEQNVIQLKN